MVSLPDQDAALTAHAGCMLVTDRDSANAGEPFILHAPIPADQLDTYMLQPCFAGADYPFGRAA